MTLGQGHFLGQGQEIILTLNTHISSLNQLVLGHRLQSFQKHSLSSLFPTEKPILQNFDLAIKYVKVPPGSSLEQTIMGRSPHSYIQSSWKSVLRFWRRRFLKRIFHIWAWWTWSKTQFILQHSSNQII